MWIGLTDFQGMNFVRMDAVQLHSDALYVNPINLHNQKQIVDIDLVNFFPCSSFWEVGGPVFVGVTVLFLWRDLLRAWHYLKKKTILSRLVRVVSSCSRDCGWTVTDDIHIYAYIIGKHSSCVGRRAFDIYMHRETIYLG